MIIKDIIEKYMKSEEIGCQEQADELDNLIKTQILGLIDELGKPLGAVDIEELKARITG